MICAHADEALAAQKTVPKVRVLVVEDEGMVGMLLEDMLTELGYQVGAIAARLKEGLQKVETERFDCAILDVNLDGESSYPIAEALTARGVPFVFVTGYGVSGLDRKYRDYSILAKPFVQSDLGATLSTLLRKG